MATSLTDIEDVRADVGAALRDAAETLDQELAAIGADTAPLRHALDSLTAGGKRLRAAFCYWSWRAHGASADSSNRSQVLRVAAALELFQASALFHDDVMDASATRRGLPTAHVEFAARHMRADWPGDSSRFGENAAILLGDLALTASNRLLAEALDDAPATIRAAATEIFGRMQTQVIAGQYLDVLGQARPFGQDPGADEARAMEVIRSKSAGYSVVHPVALGAALAGADAHSIQAAAAFSLPLGIAFQLRDDVLGVFGDTAVTGKPAGDDLREGKRTVLVCRALAAADDTQRGRLLALLGDPELDAVGVCTLQSILVDTGALAAVEGLIAECADRAGRALESADLADPGAGVLRELAQAAVDRQA